MYDFRRFAHVSVRSLCVQMESKGSGLQNVVPINGLQEQGFNKVSNELRIKRSVFLFQALPQWFIIVSSGSNLTVTFCSSAISGSNLTVTQLAVN